MIELSAVEARFVLRMLDAQIPALRVEIHRTEWNHELRRDLEREEAVLTKLRERLAAPLHPHSPAT